MRVQFPSIISYSYMDPSSSDRALSSLSQETTVIFPGDWRLMSTIAPILSASSLLSKLRISSVVMLGKVMVACEDCVVAVSSAAAKVVTASAAIIGSMNLFISSFYSQRHGSPSTDPPRVSRKREAVCWAFSRRVLPVVEPVLDIQRPSAAVWPRSSTQMHSQPWPCQLAC